MFISPQLERLVKSLAHFPGIGRKTATRLAWHIISGDKAFALELAENISKAAEVFQSCIKCNMLSESETCFICAMLERSNASICVVEHSSDVEILENMGEYDGRYFVLGHLLSPIDGYGPEEINSHKLLARIQELEPEEIILALKPSAEGEATMHFLWELLKDSGKKITRLSIGLPFGGDLEYSSSSTLRNAWQRRYGI
ncbi:MAG: recombination mediator RecR [Candidatus Cloacimonetes bacterium]|nr:recombination mediator RecR [Candidatus Cloacimonadota bacterium]